MVLRSTAQPTNDYHQIPVTERQMSLAQRIARNARIAVPEDAMADRHAMSRWIDAHKQKAQTPFDAYPTAKQVAFAERIARRRRSEIPQECFRDKTRMSRWIDANL